MSAWATIPQQTPLSSTTGTRRILFSSIIRQQSSTLISGVTVTQGLDMQSPAVISSGFLPMASSRDSALLALEIESWSYGTAKN